MLLHNSALFRIYFGNARDQLYPDWYNNLPHDKNILAISPFSELKKSMRLTTLMFLHQIHNEDGYIITQDDFAHEIPFTRDGDYMITAVRGGGIGVMTADCLPIVYFDNLNNIVAIAHAGWKSSIQQIAVRTLERMSKAFGTRPERVRIFFGPSAKACCYQVQKDFVKHLEGFAFADQVVHEHVDFLTFDLPGFNRIQLENAGVPKEAFRFQYNICTICDHNFFSYRRQGKKAGRQMTVVSLK